MTIARRDVDRTGDRARGFANLFAERRDARVAREGEEHERGRLQNL